jgi:hypothetical protein
MELSANKIFDGTLIYGVGVNGKVVCINGKGTLRRVILGKTIEVDVQQATKDDLHFIKYGKPKDDKSTNKVTVNDNQSYLDYLIVETEETTKTAVK